MSSKIKDLAALRQKVEEVKKNYPELAELRHKALTDLACQDFKCEACGESVLENREPYRVLRFKEKEYSADGFDYTVMMERFWAEEFSEALEVIKIINI
jgi:hypothetical protein